MEINIVSEIQITAFKEVLSFSNEFTFFGRFNFEREVEMNHVRDILNVVPTKTDFVCEDPCIGVHGVLDDKSLMVVDGDVQKIGHEVKKTLMLVF